MKDAGDKRLVYRVDDAMYTIVSWGFADNDTSIDQLKNRGQKMPPVPPMNS